MVFDLYQSLVNRLQIRLASADLQVVDLPRTPVALVVCVVIIIAIFVWMDGWMDVIFIFIFFISDKAALLGPFCVHRLAATVFNHLHHIYRDIAAHTP